MPRINNIYYKLIALIATFFLYALCLISANIYATDRATASLVLILGLFLTFRPSAFLHPANFIFANYLLYLIMPYSLFLVYREFKIEYLLPWGMINDWSKVSSNALYHFELTYLLFLLSAIFFYNKLMESRLRKTKPLVVYSHGASKLGVLVFTGIIFAGCLVFLSVTGGVANWLSNYSETYITGKAGVGLLNFSLIISAHCLAFIAGWMKWRDGKKFSTFIWVCISVTLLACIFLQGIKSRIPLILFFFLIPRLISAKLTLKRAVIYFLLLICLFSIGMYFRSEGFYGTPRLAVEYLQSYFNTIFLHDMVLTGSLNEDLLGSMFRGFNKFRELLGEQVPRETYDLSVALTQIYFSDTWYGGGATQQWPIETDFYLSIPQPVLWSIPIFIYTFIISMIGKEAVVGMPFFLFLYGSELVRMMSIFRSGLFNWNLFVLIAYYFIIYIIFKAFIFRQKGMVHTTDAGVS